MNNICEYFRNVKGKNGFYNIRVKFLEGKGKQKIIIKKYKSALPRGNDIELNSDLIFDDDISSDVEIIDIKQDKIIRQDNINRSRNKVIDYAYMNETKWKSFITLTYEENLDDIELSYKNFNIWIKQIQRLCKKNNDELYYLGVIEFQKRGAIHYHVLTNLECGSIYLPLQENKEKMYDVKYWKHGYTSAFDIINDVDKNFSVSSYMCKYMTKKNNDTRLLNHKKYYHSYNLDKPIEKVYLDTSNTYKTLELYLNDNNIISKNNYHHIPQQPYEKEYFLYEYEFESDVDNFNLKDILLDDLEF